MPITTVGSTPPGTGGYTPPVMGTPPGTPPGSGYPPTTPPVTPPTTPPVPGTDPYASSGSTPPNTEINPDGVFLSKVSSMLGQAGGSGFATYRTLKAGLPTGGFKNIAMTGLKGGMISGLISAGVSAVGNGIGVAQGTVTTASAVKNVLHDTIGGTVGGIAGVGIGSLGFKLLGSFMGGVPLLAASVALGAVGGTVAGQLTSNALKNGVGQNPQPLSSYLPW